MPPLGVSVIAGALIQNNCSVAIIDLDLADIQGVPPVAALSFALKNSKPSVVGITSITPTWNEMISAAKIVKEHNTQITVVAGGVHVSVFPEETLQSGNVDIVAMGESDYMLCDLLEKNQALKDIPGIAYIENGNVTKTQPRPMLEPDNIPVPAWHLLHREQYRMSRLTERRSPGGCMETSRGCPFNCCYCNKSVFGRAFRGKSPDRVMHEIEFMMDKHGVREIHIVDDGFSNDLNRAKEICRLIINSGRNISFNMFNGIRSDRLDDELCALLKKAGCWQIAFGVESGNEKVLKSVSKGLGKDTIRKAVEMCHRNGLETFGFFIIGFPEDTRDTIMETISFAVELDMNISKYDIAVPLPGTRMFEQLDSQGFIKTKDWSAYIFHRTDIEIFQHPSLSWSELEELYHLAYRKTYLRAGYIIKRFVRGLRTGDIWYDFLYFIKSRWH